jgi:hypothetical protein
LVDSLAAGIGDSGGLQEIAAIHRGVAAGHHVMGSIGEVKHIGTEAELKLLGELEFTVYTDVLID